jgi:hypothetical protein
LEHVGAVFDGPEIEDISTASLEESGGLHDTQATMRGNKHTGRKHKNQNKKTRHRSASLLEEQRS